jgi:mannose-6-phosphate isomerase-like protein (cupin superfamily)
MADDQFEEPTGSVRAGTMKVARVPTAYTRYMEGEGIPIHRGPGVHDVRELELKPWGRLGANACFIDLDNTTDLIGLQVIEIPPGGATEPMRHVFEEKYWVVEGEGTTELSLPDGSAKQRFEWHKNSLFAIPLNAKYQFVNARSTPALLLAGNAAPHMINSFDNLDFIFGCDYPFLSRYDGSADFYKPNTETLATPELGRAMWRTNIIPDIVDCDLPLDNQRSPGYRRIEPNMAGGYFWCFIGQHVPGRYSKAHSHSSGAVIMCIKGSGYTFNWPSEIGPTPWKDGMADQVERVDYVQGGIVAAAPGGGKWFHQHFGGSGQAEPLRQLFWYGGPPGFQYLEYGPKNKTNTWTNADIEEGGRSVSYRTEDPYVRQEFERMITGNGGHSTMDPQLYK